MNTHILKKILSIKEIRMNLSGFMYILSKTEYILERIDKEDIEYYYCKVFGSTGRTAVYKGKLADGKVTFIKESVVFEISLEELERLGRQAVNF